MVDGKKSTAEKIVYTALDAMAEKSGKDHLAIFEEALDPYLRPLYDALFEMLGFERVHIDVINRSWQLHG